VGSRIQTHERANIQYSVQASCSKTLNKNTQRGRYHPLPCRRLQIFRLLIHSLIYFPGTVILHITIHLYRNNHRRKKCIETLVDCKSLGSHRHRKEVNIMACLLKAVTRLRKNKLWRNNRTRKTTPAQNSSLQSRRSVGSDVFCAVLSGGCVTLQYRSSI
jgi:hypothetical protein